MANRDVGDGYWFVPKAFGIGATPVTWQGWALLLGFVALIAGANALLGHRHPVVLVTLVVATTIPVLIVAARHTRGGWHWRG